MRKDIDYLQSRLEQSQHTVDSMQEERQKAQERSDMIVMQLTRQLEQQTLLIEDMRTKSLWNRFKSALGFANS